MPYNSTSRALLLAAAIWLLAPTPADAFSPRVQRILPGGIQRGAIGELIFEGERLHDAEEVLFFDEGFEVLKIEPIEGYEVPPDESLEGDQKKKREEREYQAVRATIRVADDCRLGEHVAHLRTRGGVSEFRTFFVEPLPGIYEHEPNDELEAAQQIERNVVVAGVVKKGDEDFFAVEMQQGERLSVEIVAMRLGTHTFDSHIAVLGPDGEELASAKGSAFGVQDGILSLMAPSTGRYVIRVREDTGGGTSVSTYRLHVGTFPRPTAIYPAGGQRDTTINARCIGDIGGEFNQTFALPAEYDPEFAVSPSDSGGKVPTPIPFRLFDHGNALEAEPNDELAAATRVELPLAFNGIIERPGDVDHFRFTAQKGAVYEVECYARRVRSELDSVMELYNAEGKRIQRNDDGGKVTDNLDAETRGSDSYFRFEVPEDGEYVLRIRDLMDRGGPGFVYRVEFSPVQPWLLIRLPRAEDPNDLYGQYRQQIFVARGNYFGCIVDARRKNHRGPVILEAPNLPEGVTMRAITIPAAGGRVAAVFHAAEDAPLGGELVRFHGRDPNPDLDLRGAFRNQAELLRSRPGLAILKTKAVDRLAVVVTEEVPFRLEVEQPELTLLQGGRLDLKVKVIRAEGFDEEVVLTMPYLPRNVGTLANVKVAGDQTEAIFPLSARENTAPLPWDIFVLGSAGKQDLKWASTRPLPLQIARRFVTATLPEVTLRQGESNTLVANLTQVTPFAGQATAVLDGLPAGVTVEPVTFDADASTITFPLRAESTAPPGRHAGLRCDVTVEQEGQPLTALAGKGVLKLEAATTDALASAEPPPSNSQEGDANASGAPDGAHVADKPASRLERLRRAAQERTARRRATSGQLDMP